MERDYFPEKVIGRGSSGVVCAASLPSGERVAIKKLAGLFENITDARRLLREVRPSVDQNEHTKQEPGKVQLCACVPIAEFHTIRSSAWLPACVARDDVQKRRRAALRDLP